MGTRHAGAGRIFPRLAGEADMTTPDPRTSQREAVAASRKTRTRRGPWGMLALWLAAIAVLFLVGVLVRWLQ